jgi:hypothetical protein
MKTHSDACRPVEDPPFHAKNLTLSGAFNSRELDREFRKSARRGPHKFVFIRKIRDQKRKPGRFDRAQSGD